MPSPPNLPFIMLIWFPLMERFFKMASLYGFTYWLFNSWPSVQHHSCCAAAAGTLPDQRRMLLECGIDFRAVFCIFLLCVSVCVCGSTPYSVSRCLPDGVHVFSQKEKIAKVLSSFISLGRWLTCLAANVLTKIQPGLNNNNVYSLSQ